ncbi:hypothetical protein HDF11_001915 [Tunturiibacter psychrotolerans]
MENPSQSNYFEKSSQPGCCVGRIHPTQGQDVPFLLFLVVDKYSPCHGWLVSLPTNETDLSFRQGIPPEADPTYVTYLK